MTMPTGSELRIGADFASLSFDRMARDGEAEPRARLVWVPAPKRFEEPFDIESQANARDRVMTRDVGPHRRRLRPERMLATQHLGQPAEVFRHRVSQLRLPEIVRRLPVSEISSALSSMPGRSALKTYASSFPSSPLITPF